jgi:hypothetical protein
MTETPKEAARRLSASMLAKGYQPVALHAYTDPKGHPLYWRIRAKHPATRDKWIRPMKLNGHGYEFGVQQEGSARDRVEVLVRLREPHE